MWQPHNSQWWVFVSVALLVVFAWPPRNDRSLAIKFVNWAVDPRDELPVLPDPLALGQGDDPDAVHAHDLQTQHYDALYLKGEWSRKRLELKVANDPFNAATERQALAAFAVATVFLAWRFGGHKS